MYFVGTFFMLGFSLELGVFRWNSGFFVGSQKGFSLEQKGYFVGSKKRFFDIRQPNSD